MKPLALRKQLLIAESELNRAQLIAEWQTMNHEVRSLAGQARTFSAFAAAAASLVAGLVSFRRKKSPPAAEKPSWWRTILRGAGLAGSIWTEFRSRSEK